MAKCSFCSKDNVDIIYQDDDKRIYCMECAEKRLEELESSKSEKFYEAGGMPWVTGRDSW